jgi:DnaJ-class molecular chaperone
MKCTECNGKGEIESFRGPIEHRVEASPKMEACHECEGTGYMTPSERNIAEILNEKRMFEVLDEMNLEDVKNGTRMVSISNTVVRAIKTKKGTEVTMGCDDQVLLDIMARKVSLILVVVDEKEYFKRKK